MGNLVIPESLLEQVKMSPAEFRLEMAVYLYQSERLSIGQARRLADLDLVSFQKELAKRNIYLHYDMDDLKADIQSLGIPS
jgi:predicted HTH domain antitoxin